MGDTFNFNCNVMLHLNNALRLWLIMLDVYSRNKPLHPYNTQNARMDMYSTLFTKPILQAKLCELRRKSRKRRIVTTKNSTVKFKMTDQNAISQRRKALTASKEALDILITSFCTM